MNLINAVILANDYKAMIAWYMDVFDLKILYKEEKPLRYIELGFDQEIMLGLVPKEEHREKSIHARNNSILLQFEVVDVSAIIDKVTMHGGSVIHHHEKLDNMIYAIIRDRCKKRA
ncbi:MAG: VOC family protein [Flagellimonas sp.]